MGGFLVEVVGLDGYGDAGTVDRYIQSAEAGLDKVQRTGDVLFREDLRGGKWDWFGLEFLLSLHGST